MNARRGIKLLAWRAQNFMHDGRDFMHGRWTDRRALQGTLEFQVALFEPAARQCVLTRQAVALRIAARGLWQKGS